MRTYSPSIKSRRRLGVGFAVAAIGLATLEVGASPALAHTVAKITAAPSNGSTYTIKKGDTLGAIALKHKVSVAELVAANTLKSEHLIVAGQRLIVPSPGSQAQAGTPARGAAATSKTFDFPDRQASPGQPAPAGLRGRASYAAMNQQFDRAGASYGVPSEMLKAIAWQESGWNNAMVSSTGAVGVGQLMPDTVTFANDILIPGKALDPNKAAENIEISAAFYRYLLRENKGDHRMALASYYQGLASVRRIGLLAETQQYVRSVTAVQGNWF